MKFTEHNLPVNVYQILRWVRQCSENERRLILSELLHSEPITIQASEKSLSKDWLSQEEDDAWLSL